ncbi:hypothetical protein [Flavobacterium oreochromis]|uniref:VOC domain-containing protein n=1 Tax=Flavobacterium columnare TaxID=996 RepID=A0A246GED7_9FLAO|nr:hypothetical protein [Flavobacterium oreochromis]OWP79752.1 hypothetical protein BWK62_00515 [Flavobacterium oreochromis]
MITIIVPIFLVKDIDGLNLNSTALTKTDIVFEQAIIFYKKYIGIIEKDYEYFLIIDTFKIEVNFGLLKTETEITNQLGKAEIPLIRFSIDNNMLSLVNKMYIDGIEILSLMETLGGYVLQIKDPFNNIIQIECENFGDDNIKSIDTSKWDFYKRL